MELLPTERYTDSAEQTWVSRKIFRIRLISIASQILRMTLFLDCLSEQVEITAIRMIDVSGNLVMAIAPTATSANIEQLGTGVYFLEIQTLQGTNTTKVLKK